MAIMIPPSFDSQTSPAERRIFERLQMDPDTNGWIVLHSLGLASRGVKKPYGEIDFVVLVPDGGIICLEVKGGRVSCRNGIWHTQDRFGHESAFPRSPFQQVREGMFALMAAIHKHFASSDPIHQILLTSAVVFPDVESPPVTAEFESWECIDIKWLRTPISKILRNVIRKERERLGRGAPLVTADTLRRLRTFLRPDFDVIVTRGTTIARSEERLLRLTEEQFEVLDSVDRNKRCLIEGAAGTGKTLLALEYACRSARSGRKTVLLCFNRLLGDWFTEQVSELGLGKMLYAGSYHRMLNEIIEASSYREEFLQRKIGSHGKALFNELYPYYGELALLEGEILADTLIVDEVQDLGYPEALSVFNTWVRGGLAGGQWAFFGDFTRQAIFDVTPTMVSGESLSVDEAKSGPSIKIMLETHSDHFTCLILKKNCRNTKPIGEETALLSGFESLPYRLDSYESLPVDYRWWQAQESQKQVLDGVLSMLIEQGVGLQDVTILSPLRFQGSVASKLGNESKHAIIPLDGSGTRHGFVFSTIHAFKGMESPVVVLCDIDQMGNQEIQALLYVGMSRARSHLILLLHDSLKEAMQMAVKRRLTTEWSS